MRALLIILIMGVAVESVHAESNTMVETLSVDCALAVAVVLDQVHKDRLFGATKAENLEALRSRYSKVTCTQNSDFFSVEIGRDISEEVRGGAIYFELDPKTFDVLEKSID